MIVASILHLQCLQSFIFHSTWLAGWLAWVRLSDVAETLQEFLTEPLCVGGDWTAGLDWLTPLWLYSLQFAAPLWDIAIDAEYNRITSIVENSIDEENNVDGGFSNLENTKTVITFIFCNVPCLPDQPGWLKS